MGYTFPSLGQLVGFSDSEKSFISVAALIAKRRGAVVSSSEGSNPELNTEECTFQTSHHLYESMIPGTGGGAEGGVRISQDGQSRVECIVRLMKGVGYGCP